MLQQQYKQQEREQLHLMEQYKQQVGEKPKTETSIQNIRMDNSDYGSHTKGRKRLFQPNEDISQREEDKPSRPKNQHQFAFQASQNREFQSPQVQKDS